jgi:hypothetical protein
MVRVSLEEQEANALTINTLLAPSQTTEGEDESSIK